MSEMVERVARALCESVGWDAGALVAGQGRPCWTAFIPQARAAIAALREPTAAMLAERWGIRLAGYGDGGDYLDEDGACDLWEKMIDAALKE